ncbi:maleylpyruvate isomerase N-terminal domain-containing protein [Plantactinospora siamensis]|uniref:Maleylpyruvate isomerase N-terminal domain-containing protein n=1 Tax=Plantactinospora siamensis TaxID=555372 RepID=A0ABV6NUK3_9ACTN
MDHRQVYLAAAEAFVELVGRIPDDRWDRPGLGVWTVRELTGHTVSAGLRGVLTSLAQPAQRCDLPSAARYYALARSVDPAFYRAAVAASEDDARRQAAALGEQPSAVVGPLLSEVAAVLGSAEGGALVQTPGGGMRLADWLQTRTLELAVHGLDLAGAAGVPAGMPNEALAEASGLAARVGVEVGDGATVLLALTGRGGLPPDFCVL